MVAHAQKNINKLTGADDFLPTLIYTVLKAKPSNVACDISFIRYSILEKEIIITDFL